MKFFLRPRTGDIKCPSLLLDLRRRDRLRIRRHALRRIDDMDDIELEPLTAMEGHQPHTAPRLVPDGRPLQLLPVVLRVGEPLPLIRLLPRGQLQRIHYSMDAVKLRMIFLGPRLKIAHIPHAEANVDDRGFGWQGAYGL